MSATVRLAKQGDARAITQLINQQLEPRGIKAQASREGSCLHITLEAKQAVPPQQTVVGYLRQALERLSAASIDEARIYAKRLGDEELGWQEDIPLLPPSERRALRRRRRSVFRRCFRIWAHWQAIGLGVSFVFLVVLAAMVLALMVIASDLGWERPQLGAQVTMIAVAALFFWGLILGDAQTEVLLQRLRRAMLWKWATAIGLPLGLASGLGLLFYGQDWVLRLVGLLPFSIDGSIFLGLVMPFAAGLSGFFVLGLLQWLSIARQVKHSFRWLVSSTCGGALSAAIGASGSRLLSQMLIKHWNLADVPEMGVALVVVICTFLVWFSYQAITGVTIARMLHRRPKVRFRHRKPSLKGRMRGKVA